MSNDHRERYIFASGFVEHKRVFDIACGAGYGSFMLAKSGASHVTGADVSGDSVMAASLKYQADNLEFVTRSMLEIEDENIWDVITSFESIEHIDDYMGVLRRFYRALKRGGVLILSTPNRLVTSPYLKNMNERPGNSYHVREFSVDEIVSAVRLAGFSISERGIFGQRQRRLFRNRYLRKLQKIFMNPDRRSSPMVTPLSNAPRYTVIVTRKQ